MSVIHKQIELRASPARRGFAVAVLGGMCVLLVALGIKGGSPLVPWAFAAVIGYVGYRLYHATAGGLRLTPDHIETLDGEVIATMDQIVSVDRGVFAFKPSNGFLITTQTRAPARWAPGLWWRRGRRIGVGGVTPSGPAKAIAEEIAMRIASR